MKHKIYSIVLLAAVALTSCSFLKKDKQSIKTKHQKEELQFSAQHQVITHQNQLVLMDSSYNDFTLMLWPKGKFTFSIANGFEGEAERLLIKRKQSQQKVLHMRQETKQDSIVLKANYNNEKESSTAVKKNKLSVGYNWAWIVVLLISFVLIWVYKKGN